MIVPYTQCQYPQVVPFSDAQFQAIVNSAGANGAGMGDYLEQFGWPIPQYLTPGNNRGLGCACGGSCCEGLGGLTFDGTGLLGSGLFSGGMDLSTWGAAEYTLLAGVAYMLYATVFTTKAAARKVATIPGRVKKRGKKIKRGFFD